MKQNSENIGNGYALANFVTFSISDRASASSLIINGNVVGGFLQIKKTDVEKYAEMMHHHNFREMKKEFYYITAITNLIKKTEFLQLLIQLEEKSITEEEYEKEIEDNPSKYIIDTDYLKSQDDLTLISEIVNKIGVSMRTDDVAEIFSLELNSLNNGLKALSF